ncbi:MAG: TIGR00730 family Rossman fold protein [Calditrichaceae bacterium]
MNINRIAVFASSSNTIDPHFILSATELGKAFVLHNKELVFGGANVGLMRHLADTILDGNKNVIGVMPEVLVNKGIGYTNASQFYITKDMRSRKAKMEELSDAFIALPGGFGTLEELMEIITSKQLGLHKKPIAILNTHNFYDSLLDQFDTFYNLNFSRSAYRDLYFVSESVHEIFDYFASYIPPKEIHKWT